MLCTAGSIQLSPSRVAGKACSCVLNQNWVFRDRDAWRGYLSNVCHAKLLPKESLILLKQYSLSYMFKLKIDSEIACSILSLIN